MGVIEMDDHNGGTSALQNYLTYQITELLNFRGIMDTFHAGPQSQTGAQRVSHRTRYFNLLGRANQNVSGASGASVV